MKRPQGGSDRRAGTAAASPTTSVGPTARADLAGARGLALIDVRSDRLGLQGLQSRPERRDRLDLAVRLDDELATRKSLPLGQALACELVGLELSTAVRIMRQRAAVRVGRAGVFRVIVSNFNAAFRMVAANLTVSVVPIDVGVPCATTRSAKLVPLTGAWIERSLAICFRDFAPIRPASQRLVEPLAGRPANADAKT